MLISHLLYRIRRVIMTESCGFMGIRHADVNLVSLHPVATATLANISRNCVSHLERLSFSVLSL